MGSMKDPSPQPSGSAPSIRLPIARHRHLRTDWQTARFTNVGESTAKWRLTPLSMVTRRASWMTH